MEELVLQNMAIQWKRYFRLKRLYSCIRFAISYNPSLGKTLGYTEKKNLLLIKTEAIGDYVLFRNFLQTIRQSAKFKGYHITFLGNKIWQDLANEFDKEYFDASIFIDRKRFQTDFYYRNEVFLELTKTTYDTAINATYSREYLLGDSIIKMVSAREKIGMMGDSASEIPYVKFFADSYYSRLVENGKENFFEFDRNIHFFDQILVDAKTPSMPSFSLGSNRKNYIVMLPGAQDEIRQWPIENFKSVAEWIHQKYGLEIIISGSKADRAAAEFICNDSNSSFIKNYCGEGNLVYLVKLLSEARLAICNDSGTLHLAAALNIPSVCISNGNHYGRFTPYPKNWNKKLAFVYPPKFMEVFTLEDERMNAMKWGSKYSISSISTELVQTEIERLLDNG